jgi:thiol-disulfide isomerase/thioredoxin
LRRLELAIGVLIVAVPLASAGLDLSQGIAGWDRLAPLGTGERVEDFQVVTLDGEFVDSARLRGKVSVVTFWATWCGACAGELDDLDQLHGRYDDRVRFIAINHDGGGIRPEQARTRVAGYRRARQLELPMAIDDGSMLRRFRVGPIPHTVIVDRYATIRHVHQGRVPISTLREEIDALLAQN